MRRGRSASPSSMPWTSVGECSISGGAISNFSNVRRLRGTKKMRYLMIVLLLAGCGRSPNEIREHGDKLAYTSAKMPKEAALCLAKAAEEYRPDFQTQVREHLDQYFEVRVTNIYAIMVVGDVRPADAGSSVTLWQPFT